MSRRGTAEYKSALAGSEKQVCDKREATRATRKLGVRISAPPE
jgi:hypothetical protein